MDLGVRLIKTYLFDKGQCDFQPMTMANIDWDQLKRDENNYHWFSNSEKSDAEFILVPMPGDGYVLYRRASLWGNLPYGANWTLYGKSYEGDPTLRVGCVDLKQLFKGREW